MNKKALEDLYEINEKLKSTNDLLNADDMFREASGLLGGGV